MKVLKHLNACSIGKPILKDRFTFITDESIKLVIPVGPHFQADVPFIGDRETDNAKWAGALIWPIKGGNQEDDIADNLVGKGRSKEICECVFPGSKKCVRRHISNKKFKLQIDLGPAFWKWKFDDMGEDVSKLWNLEEQKKFQYVVKMTANSQGGSFMKFALQCFPGKTKKNIVSYYLNVYIPRRISVQTRLGCTTLDTDDDDEEDLPSPKGSRKRFQVNHITSRSSKYIKTMYLTARR